MITWQKKDFGFHLTFVHPITSEEADRWIIEVKETVSQMNEAFHVFVDLRKFEIVSSNIKPVLEQVQTICKENGLGRSVVILSNEITAMQFKIIAKKTGIYEWERYIDAASNSNYVELGMNWIIKGIDPDNITDTPTPVTLSSK